MSGTGSSSRVAIVTGAGSGIGAAIARALSADGIAVFAVDKSAEGLGDLGAAGSLVADVTAPDAAATIFSACRAELGSPRILVNNAGLGNARPAHETSDDDLARYLDINLGSVFRLSRAMIEGTGEGERIIVNIASVFGQVGFPGSAPYSAAKAGVIGLTRQMAADYGALNVRINAIAPGLIATPATADRIANNERFRRLTIGQIPAGRPGTPEDVAGVALFLCSPAASYVCGQVITVDGGWTATRYSA